MKRREDWPEVLLAFLSDHRDTPFAWGDHDCVTFAANWVARATGVDPIVEHRGRWTDEETAYAVIHEVGGIANYFDNKLARLPAPLLAQRGDLGMVASARGEDFPALAINAGTHWAGPGPEGMLMLPLTAAKAAWAVGRAV